MGQVKSTLVHWHEHHVDAGFGCQRRHQQRFGEESRSRRKGKGEVEGKKVAENGGKGDGEPSTRRKREKRGFDQSQKKAVLSTRAIQTTGTVADKIPTAPIAE